jgi:hypothetical protein
VTGDDGFEEWGFLEVSRGGAIRPGFFVVACGAIDLRTTHGEGL